jgi:nicotinate-nucleotide adenylyltransferase
VPSNAKSSPRRRIGLLGGSFDPVHPGHLALGRAAAIALRLDEIRLIPVARSWQKQETRASSEQRLAMLSLALQAEGEKLNTGVSLPCKWTIDPQEVLRGPPTYTIDTLEALRLDGNQDQLCLILGSDQFSRLHTWHRPHELLHYCHIAVTTRLPFLLNQLGPEAEHFMKEYGVEALPETPAGKITTFRMQAVHLSSTQVRGLLASERKLGLELLHPNVAAYVEQFGLYS